MLVLMHWVKSIMTWVCTSHSVPPWTLADWPRRAEIGRVLEPTPI